jgi:sulfatase modifying factor 1
MRATPIASSAFAAALLVVLCGEEPPGPSGSGEATAPEDEEATVEAPAQRGVDAGGVAAVDGGTADAEAAGPCPEDMVHVETMYCTDVERRCVDMEQEKTNHLPICHAFAHEQRCRVQPRPISFCIDRYEYPDRRGAHPTWMIDWYQAQATCESKGKRLCWASEWTAACEGPEQTPFPYGWERDHDKCNMDNFYVEPRKFGPKGQFLFYSKDADVQSAELSRLDRSVPSGSLESCQSGFGVYDLPGNLDEWVVSDEPPREISKWAGLKGGAWGHVRSQCRPTTFSHDAGFSYYFVGFRCCKDVAGAPAWAPAAEAIPAPSVEPHDYAPDEVTSAAEVGGPRKAKWSRSGKVE